MRNKTLLLILFLFLLFRLLILLTNVESVSWYEELQMGVLPKDLLQGLKFPFWDYQTASYHGASIFIGLLGVPFFFLFGPSLFSLKLVGLFVSFLTLICLFFFLRRFFGRRVAILTGLLFVFCPPLYSQLSLIPGINSHGESTLFSIASLFAFYRFFYEERRKLFYLFLSGLSAGLGFWVSYLAFIATLACLATWFLLDRRSFLSRNLVFFLGSFLIGILPFIAYNMTHRFAGMHFILLHLGGNPWRRAISTNIHFFTQMVLSIPWRIGSILYQSLPRSFYFQSFFNLSGTKLSFSYYTVSLFLIFSFLKSQGRLLPLVQRSLQEGGVPSEKRSETKPLFFLLYPLFFIGVYSISLIELTVRADVFNSNPIALPNPILFRFYAPLYFFIFPLLALAVRRTKLTRLLFVFLLMLGIIGQSSLLFKEPFGRALLYRGYSYYERTRLWIGHAVLSPEVTELIQRIEKHPTPENRFFFLSFISSAHKAGRGKESPEEVVRRFQEAPAVYFPYFVEHLGMVSFSRDRQEREQILALIGRMSEENQARYYRGLAKLAKFPFRNRPHEYLDFVARQPISHQRWFYFSWAEFLCRWARRGQWISVLEASKNLGVKERAWLYRGVGYYQYTFGGFHSVRALLVEAPNREVQLNLLWGLGWGLRESFIEDRIRAVDWLKRLPEELQPGALRGMKAFEAWYGI